MLFKAAAAAASTTLITLNPANIDLAIGCDRSGSMVMDEFKMPNGQTRWKYVEEPIKLFVQEAGKYDDDGIDMYFFNRSVQREINVTPTRFPELWNTQVPGGGTDTLGCLNMMLDSALGRIKTSGEKNQFIVLLTDGQPDPGTEELIAKTIVKAVNTLTRKEQMTILILQVGNDVHATAFLKKLNDDLGQLGAKYDCVAVGNIDEIAGHSIPDIINAAVNG